MSYQKTVPEQREPITEALSCADTRVISHGSAKRADLKPRMVLARRTLAGFVINNQGGPLRFKHQFEIAGSGRLTTSEIQHWTLIDNNSQGVQSFTVIFEYHGREALTQLCATSDAYHKLRKFLYGHNLIFRSASGAGVNKVTIEPTVPAALTVSANPRVGAITITLRNVLLLGTTQYELASERMDREFIDSLTGLISGQLSAFYTLGTKVSSQAES